MSKVHDSHTPGPWHVGIGNGEGSVFADDGRMRLEARGTTLYPVCKVGTGWHGPEDEANARLIAAAPDLLAACRAAVRHLDPDLLGETPAHLIRQAYAGLLAAVEKATDTH